MLRGKLLLWNLSLYAVVMCPSVCMSVCLHEKAQIWLFLAAFGALKFGFGDLLLFGLLLNIDGDEFSVYFVVSKLLILAYFSNANLTKFLIKICWHF